MEKKRFALNRMIFPGPGIEAFFKLTRRAGLNTVELRNDLGGKGVADSFDAYMLKDLLSKYSIGIESVNAVQKFNLPSNYEKAYTEISELIEFSLVTGCRAIVLCPNNDVYDKRSGKDLFSDTRDALKKYGPLFAESGVTGLVEPLGFTECSVRSKKAAIEAITESGFEKTFMVVHDTFHHYLGTDSKIYPEYTGLVHISGVEDKVSDSIMRDCNRVLVSSADLISNRNQILELEKAGYRGFYSFEPFSAAIHDLSEDKVLKAVSDSIDYLIETHLIA